MDHLGILGFYSTALMVQDRVQVPMTLWTVGSHGHLSSCLLESGFNTPHGVRISRRDRLGVAL